MTPGTDQHEDSATHRLGRLMHQLRGLAVPSPEDLVDIDLPRHQLRALFIVAKHGPMSVSALAAATDASLASTSSLAERLVKSGHLRRQTDPDDRRKVLLTATEQGAEVIDQLTARFRARFERVVEAMSPDGRTALETGLTDMIHAAEALGLHPDADPHHGGHP